MPTVLPVEGRKLIAAKPRLLDEVRAVARMRHLSIRTEKAYVSWIHPVRYGIELSFLCLCPAVIERSDVLRRIYKEPKE